MTAQYLPFGCFQFTLRLGSASRVLFLCVCVCVYACLLVYFYLYQEFGKVRTFWLVFSSSEGEDLGLLLKLVKFGLGSVRYWLGLGMYL